MIWSELIKRKSSLCPPTCAIAACTFAEALRNRLGWLVAFLILLGFSLAEFIGAVAVTETLAFQAAFLGSYLRLAMVVLVSVFVVTSTLREFNDNGVLLVLSLPIPRWVYLLGKLSGFALVAVVGSMLCALTLMLYSPWEQALLWSVTFGGELLIVIALGLLCLLTFSQITAALCAVLVFYACARTIRTIELMTNGAFAQSDSLAQDFIDNFVAGLAALLPALHRFAPTEWLVYHSGHWGAALDILAQSCIYVALLTAAALFDVYRRNF